MAKRSSSFQPSPGNVSPPSQETQDSPGLHQDQPPQSKAQSKTSRHTQTHRPPTESSTQRTEPYRPIPPLFPRPCPWQTGSYPQGPVRQLPQSFQQPTSQTSASRTKQHRQPKPKTAAAPPPRNPPPSSRAPPPSCPSPQQTSPWIEELPASTAGLPPSQAATSTSTGPEDRNSLNF